MNPADPQSNPLHEQTTAQPVAGRKFGQGRFVLQRLLKRGGMGAVWLARDERLEKSVALKFLPPALADNPAALAQLRRETAHSLRLTHPHIVRIHDLHEAPGEEPFIVMEFVDGQSLTDLRAAQPAGVLPWETLAPLVKQLCAALEYAHAEKVIHRDLKPSNLMLDRQGRLKLADFGIAVVISETMTRVTGERAGSSGTVAYMSPQQVNGELPKITDDIYSLGVTLFELLTGTPPFHSGEIVHQVLHKPPPSLGERLRELMIENPVPPHVGQTILACLAKEPGQRPQNARDVAERLQLGAVTESFFPPTPTNRRRMMTVTLAAAALVAAGFLWWAFRPGGILSPAKSPSDSATRSHAVVPAKAANGLPATALFAESFESVDESGLPPGWFCAAYGREIDGRSPAVEVVREAGAAFLRCRMVASRDPAFVVRWVDVPPGVPLRVRARVRVSPLKIEPQFTGAGAVVRCVWALDDGRKIKGSGTTQVQLRASTTGWEQHEFLVPPSSPPATRLVLEAGLVGAVGVCDVDDLVIEADAPAAPPPASSPARVRELFADDFEKSPASAVIPNWQSDKASQSSASRGKLVIALIDGNKFLRISTTRESPSPIQVFRVVPRDKNTLLEIFARARATALFTNEVRAAHVMKCVFLDPSGSALSEFAPPGGTVRLEAGLHWARLTCRIVPPGNTASIRLHLSVPPGTGTVDFDNVRVTAWE